jgi:hypothetical protein
MHFYQSYQDASEIKIELPDINQQLLPQRKIPVYDTLNIDNIINSKPFKTLKSTKK